MRHLLQVSRLCVLLVSAVLINTECIDAQGLLPTPPAEYQQLTEYDPGRVTVVREVNGDRVTEERAIVALPLPATFDLSDHLPKPGQQKHNDCVGWACARGVYSYQLGLNRDRKPAKPFDLFSPGYIYSQIAIPNPDGSPGDNGSYFFHSTKPNAVAILRSQGCATEATMPYDASPDGWKTQPGQSARNEAKNVRAFFHQRVSDLKGIKYAITQHYPVLLGIQTDSNFNDGTDTSIYRWSGNSGNIGHAVVAIGFDDTKSAVRLMNSYGANWKDNGFCWVAYDQFDTIGSGKWCYEAHVIRVIDENLPQYESTSTPNRNFILNTDRRVYENGQAIAGSQETREIATTNKWLYALRTDGRVFAYAKDLQTQQDVWDNISSPQSPAGLNGQLVGMIAATPKYLYAMTKSGRVYGRVPTSQNGPRHWERIDLPQGQKAVDLRFRDGLIRGTSESGIVYRRVAGQGWFPN